MQLMRRYWGEMIGALAFIAMLLLVIFLVPAQGAVRQPADPPECVKVNIIENSGNGPILYTVFCGTGSEGISPLLRMVAGNGPLIVDGGPITAAACTQAVRCGIVWPKSPQTGQ